MGLKDHKIKMLKFGDNTQGSSERFMLSSVMTGVRAFFLFKRRKGDLLAGCATFFAVLSFCPVLLLLVSAMSMIIGNGPEAQELVVTTFKNSFPQLAKWIVDSISTILANQLHSNTGRNILNLVFMLYSSLGMVATMMFGLDVLSKEESKGGFIFEDAKAMISGALLYGFMLVLIFSTQKTLVMNLVQQVAPWASMPMAHLTKTNALPVLLSLGFFTIFYKWTILLPLSWKDSFKGAVTFVACLAIGKSFYWVYIQLVRADIQANYGNFETLITAVLWVYFMMCAFFYGASMAALPHLDPQQAAAAKGVPSDVAPAVPQVESSGDDRAA